MINSTINDLRRTKPLVAVAICTCRNPGGLEKALRALAINSRPGLPEYVVVVDNDEKCEGMRVVDMLQPELPFPILFESELRSGIPFARNAALSLALTREFSYLAMIDDDEYPSRQWLDEFLAVAKLTQADIIGGPVEPVFEGDLHPSLSPEDFRKVGGRMVRGNWLVESTANVLLSRSVIERSKGSWFSHEYAATGGSDTEFFRRLALQGYTHAIAPNALVFEDIPATRTTPDWALQRAYRTGNSLARTRRLHFGRLTASLFEIINVGGLIAQALWFVVASIKARRYWLRSRLKIARARGKIAGMLGYKYEEYAPSRYRQERS